MAVALVLSVLGKLPLQGRLLLFLLPGFYLVIAQGLSSIMGGTLWRKILGAGLFIVVLVQPLTLAARSVVPEETPDIRSVAFYFKAHQQPGDKLYLNNEAQWGFDFYCLLFKPVKIVSLGIILQDLEQDNRGKFGGIVSSDDTVKSRIYASDSVYTTGPESPGGVWTQLPRSGRTWVLFSQMNPVTEQFFLQCFDQWGQRLDTVKRQNAALYLYDLSGPVPGPH
jgi:hypothetical protein